MQHDSTKEKIYDVIIIGGGPAGATAALYTARAELETMVVDKGLTAGALGITNRIVNYPGVNEDISGAELLERMRDQARSFGAEFISDKVIGADLHADKKTVFGNAGTYTARSVIIATGSMGRGNLVKGEAELLGRGVSYCAVCDAAFFKDQEVLVAGNSDEAAEEALYLAKFASRVLFLNPKEELIAPEELIKKVEENPAIHMIPNARLLEIIGNGRVDSARFRQAGESERTIPVNGAFIYLQGGRPVTDFLQGQLALNEGGCIAVDSEYRASAPGVFAVGDVICTHVKQVVVAAGEGASAGMAAEKALRGRRKVVVDWAK